MASLRVIRRKDTGTLWIVGTSAGQRIRRAAGTTNKCLAKERAAQLEADMLREEWHGPKRGGRTITQAALSYAKAQQRRPSELHRLTRVIDMVGPGTLLRNIDQDTVSRIGAGYNPATLQREIITPLRAILMFAARRKWCDVPLFETQRQAPGRTLFLLPDEAERLIGGAVPHLRPLLLFLLGAGARLSEALELEWRDVDLEGRKVIFWRTKNGKRRVAELPSRVCAVLHQMQTGTLCEDRAFPHWRLTDRNRGGQIKTAFRSAVSRAGLNPALSPHCLRHTWATWHYALNRDILALKEAGGWGSVALVERYAHLMPAGQEATIREFLGLDGPQLRVVA